MTAQISTAQFCELSRRAQRTLSIWPLLSLNEYAGGNFEPLRLAAAARFGRCIEHAGAAGKLRGDLINAVLSGARLSQFNRSDRERLGRLDRKLRRSIALKPGRIYANTKLSRFASNRRVMRAAVRRPPLRRTRVYSSSGRPSDRLNSRMR